MGEQLAVPMLFSPNLRNDPLPAGISPPVRRILRMGSNWPKRSLIGADVDVVVIDCPNRQAGRLTISAFHAADGVICTVAAPTQQASMA